MHLNNITLPAHTIYTDEQTAAHAAVQQSNHSSAGFVQAIVTNEICLIPASVLRIGQLTGNLENGSATTTLFSTPTKRDRFDYFHPYNLVNICVGDFERS
jgi:hypothetical protein